MVASVRDPWTKREIEHLMREIPKIVSPFANLSYPFKVRVIAPEFDIDIDIDQESVRTLDAFNNATVSLSVDFDGVKGSKQADTPLCFIPLLLYLGRKVF